MKERVEILQPDIQLTAQTLWGRGPKQCVATWQSGRVPWSQLDGRQKLPFCARGDDGADGFFKLRAQRREKTP